MANKQTTVCTYLPAEFLTTSDWTYSLPTQSEINLAKYNPFLDRLMCTLD